MQRSWEDHAEVIGVGLVNIIILHSVQPQHRQQGDLASYMHPGHRQLCQCHSGLCEGNMCQQGSPDHTCP